jgi:hypothetical protein
LIANKEIQLYKYCDDLPVFNFYKAVFCHELNWLIVNPSERDQEVDDLDILLDTLTKEYAVLSHDKKGLKLRKTMFKLMELEYKYKGVVSVLKMYSISSNPKILDVINDFGVKYCLDKGRTIDEEIDSVFYRLKLLKNKINVLRVNIKSNSVTPVDNDDALANLDSEALFFESFLELGYFIDKKSVSVERWIGMRNMVSEKNKAIVNRK